METCTQPTKNAPMIEGIVRRRSGGNLGISGLQAGSGELERLALGTFDVGGLEQIRIVHETTAKVVGAEVSENLRAGFAVRVLLEVLEHLREPLASLARASATLSGGWSLLGTLGGFRLRGLLRGLRGSGFGRGHFGFGRGDGHNLAPGLRPVVFLVRRGGLGFASSNKRVIVYPAEKVKSL